MNQPQQNKLEIAVLKANHKNMKEDIGEIKEQVSNHIPTQIKELDKRIDNLAVKLAGVVAIITFLVNYFIK